MKKRRVARPWLVNLALFAGVCLFLFLVAEVGARILFHDRFLSEADPVLGSHHIAGKTAWQCSPEYCEPRTANAEGWVDGPFSELPVPSARVALVGDSFVAGLQVASDAVIDRAMERRYRAEGEDISVLNFGHSGFGPDQYLLVTRLVQERYSPSAVVVVVYLGNDLRNINPALEGNPCKPYFALNDTALKDPLPFSCERSLPSTVIRSVAKRSMFLNWVHATITTATQRNLGAVDGAGVPVDYLVYDPANEEYNKSYALLGAILSRMRTEAESHGSRLVIAIAPASETVDPQRWKLLEDTYPGLNRVKTDVDYPRRRVLALCRERSLPCLDLTPGFVDGSKNESLFFAYDGHWTAAGHALAGKLLVDELAR